jgi:hypothetical protein
MKAILSILFFLTFIPYVFSQSGIKGVVVNEAGETLPQAGIYIKNTSSGTSTNMDGKFEIKLEPGNYQIIFQYLGYQTQVQNIQVGDEMKNISVVMSAQTYTLSEVKVKSKGEDPSYSVIRRAIAMAKFYQNQIAEYQARVYVKGSGRVNKVPGIAKNYFKKEGFDPDQVYMIENISELKYIHPNKFSEKVISVRSTIPTEFPDPVGYFRSSFYQNKVATVVSPLASYAFGYYKFKLEGSFMEGDNLIHKITVTPRSNGDDVFQGSLFIVDNLWCIHSLDLTTYKEGFKIRVKQNYTEVTDKVWMPHNQGLFVTGSIYGFGIEANYVASLSNYKVKVNQKLTIPDEVIDEKTEPEKTRELKKIEMPGKNDTKKVEDLLAENKKVSRKDMRKLMKEYEKQEKKELELPQVDFERNQEVDTLAYKRDSLFWVDARPLPLSELEVKSYNKRDSIVKVEGFTSDKNEDDEKDGVTVSAGVKKKSGKNPLDDVLWGKTFKLDTAKKQTLRYHSPMEEIIFNTVEGYAGNLRLTYRNKISDKTTFTLSPVARYAFAREAFSGKGLAKLNWLNGDKKRMIQLEGGRYISQINQDNPVSLMLNTAATLMFKRNFVKLYERSYAELKTDFDLNDRLSIKIGAGWEERYQLRDTALTTYIEWRNRSFTSNQPYNIEVGTTDFPIHQAFITSISFKLRPEQRFYMRNGKKYKLDRKGPVFEAEYTKGWFGVLESDVDYDRAELKMIHNISWGARGKFQYQITAGKFLNNNRMAFVDFRHFMGNRIFVTVDNTSWRALDYYTFSTRDEYAEILTMYSFRKLGLTQFNFFRMYGLHEHIFLNTLITPKSENYTEAGYVLDNIFRFARLELYTSFRNYSFAEFGIRVGINVGFLKNQ